MHRLSMNSTMSVYKFVWDASNQQTHILMDVRECLDSYLIRTMLTRSSHHWPQLQHPSLTPHMNARLPLC